MDTFRLKYELNRRNYYNIDLCCIGEHGGDLIVPFNSIKFNNKDCDVSKIYSISNQLIDNINLLSNRIMETKNSTTWGISAAVLKIIDAIINDKKVILPISHYVNLPFLNDEICFSYPAKIGANGIIEQFDMELLSQEQTILKEISCKTKKALNLAKIMKEKIQ